MKTDEQEQKKDVEDFKKAIAKAIVEIAKCEEKFKYLCEELEWNDEPVYMINDAIGNMGKALSMLELWYDDEEEPKK